MNKRTLAGLGLAVALTVSGVSPQAAMAYPPGRVLTVTSSVNLLQYRSGTFIEANHLAAGSLKFSVNGKLGKYFPIYASGSSQKWPFWPKAPGKYDVVATSGLESASTSVYVPLQTFPRAVSVRKSFTINLKYVAPGTAVYATVNGKRVASGTADANGLLTLVAPPGSFTRGVANQLLINYGGAFTGGAPIKALR